MARRAATHPDEPLVEIVGIEEHNRGRSCEEHSVCGNVLRSDFVVRFRRIQILNGKLLLLLICDRFGEHVTYLFSFCSQLVCLFIQMTTRKKLHWAFIG